MTYKHYLIFTVSYVFPMAIILLIVNMIIGNQKIIMQTQTKILILLDSRTDRFLAIEKEIRELRNE